MKALHGFVLFFGLMVSLPALAQPTQEDVKTAKLATAIVPADPAHVRFLRVQLDYDTYSPMRGVLSQVKWHLVIQDPKGALIHSEWTHPMSVEGEQNSALLDVSALQERLGKGFTVKVDGVAYDTRNQACWRNEEWVRPLLEKHKSCDQIPWYEPKGSSVVGGTIAFLSEPSKKEKLEQRCLAEAQQSIEKVYVQFPATRKRGIMMNDGNGDLSEEGEAYLEGMSSVCASYMTAKLIVGFMNWGKELEKKAQTDGLGKGPLVQPEAPGAKHDVGAVLAHEE